MRPPRRRCSSVSSAPKSRVRQRLVLGGAGDARRGRRRSAASVTALMHWRPSAHRDAERVDDLDRARPLQGLRGDLGGLHRGREAGGEVDADDAVGALGGEPPERLPRRRRPTVPRSRAARPRWRPCARTPRWSARPGRRTPSLPKRIVSGTISIPSSSARATGRSHELSVTTRTPTGPPGFDDGGVGPSTR